MLRDQHGRTIDYLRLAVTDRCNLRCRYCMPEEGIDFLDRKALLNYDEIISLSYVFREMGIKKLRITGGEPFVRKDMPNLISALANIFPEVHITTNGVLSKQHLPKMVIDGIKSLNISLDTLDSHKFHLITKRDKFKEVISFIEEAANTNISIKVNCVVMKGINDEEVIPFLEWGKNLGVKVRFIEAMPFNDYDGNQGLFLDISSIESIIRKKYSIERKSSIKKSSISYVSSAGHSFGIIPAFSRSLCGTCNRIRLTPQGEMITCLYAQSGLDLKSLLRSNVDLSDIKATIQKAVYDKHKNGFIAASNEEKVLRSMTTIGG